MNEDLVQKVSEKNGSFKAPSRHSRNFTKKHSKKLEDLPSHQAMTDSGDQKFHNKQRGFHVSPVLGFLRKNLGRPWDLVYSDLCKIAKSDEDRQFIKTKLSWYVSDYVGDGNHWISNMVVVYWFGKISGIYEE